MNVFGFMAHPDQTRESEHHSSGNYATLDQIAALHWIKRNIAGAERHGSFPSNACGGLERIKRIG
jgi:carboxylesterase type B